MLKNISNLGKALNKAEQQEINGGRLSSGCSTGPPVIALCDTDEDCGQNGICCPHGNCLYPNPWGL